MKSTRMPCCINSGVVVVVVVIAVASGNELGVLFDHSGLLVARSKTNTDVARLIYSVQAPRHYTHATWADQFI